MDTTRQSIRQLMAVAVLAVTMSAFGQVPSRVTGEIKGSAQVRLAGTTSPLIARSIDRGRLPADRQLGRMVLMLAPTAAQETAAKALVKDLHDSSSPKFHKWLTPDEFGKRFGVTDNDAAAVRAWLESNGLVVHEVANSRRFMVFSGSVAQVENAFSVEMHSYSRKGQDFIANASEIKVPAALAPVVRGVVRLHSDPPTEQIRVGGRIKWDPSTKQWTPGTGAHFLAPADFAIIYNLNPLYQAGIDGTGQKIAIVARSNIFLDDIQSFRSMFNLPANDPEIIVNGDDPGQPYSEFAEPTLDATWAGAVAPNAHIMLVVSQSNFSDGVDVSASYIVDHNLAPIMSTSFSLCEANMTTVQAAFYSAIWQQAAAEGITAFVSSGDNGGAGCDAAGGGTYAFNGLNVNGIASTPYNVAVGGTQFDEGSDPSQYWAEVNDPTTQASVQSYIPERVWNESSNDPNSVGLWAGGGGVSALYSKPDWQTAPGVPADGMRDVPDVSLSAALHDGYLLCLDHYCSYGALNYAGGTSASAPAAAGIMALVNQKLGGQPQGLANYVFYRLAATPGVYHDTTVGDNKVPDQSGMYTVGYAAGPGYDLASGLGSFDANALVTNWATASATAGSNTVLALAAGSSNKTVHGAPIGFQATVHCSGTGCTPPTGNVALAATSGSNSIGAGAGSLVAASSGSVADITAGNIPGGSYNVSARYSGDGTYYASNSNSVAVTVTPEPSNTIVGSIGGGVLTAAPIGVEYGSPLQLGSIVYGNSGMGYPSGTLAMTVDGSPVTTFKIDYNQGAWVPTTLTLNYGENSNILMPGVTTQSESSTVTYLPAYVTNYTQNFPAGAHTVQVSYPGDASFAASTSNAFTYNVTKGHIIMQDFFPLGTQVQGVPVHLMGQLGFASNWYAPFTGTVTITDITGSTPVVLGTGPVLRYIPGTTDEVPVYDIIVTVTTPGAGDSCPNGWPGPCHTLKVDFSGDSNTLPTSATYWVPFPTTTGNLYMNLSADSASIVAGGTVNLTAQVQTDVRAYTATGTVTFYDGTTSLGTATLDATGTATLAVSSLAPGVHNSINAMYGGDSILQSTSGGPITVNVTDYTVQSNPASLTITSGSSGSANLAILPIGGSTQTVQISCASSSLPTNMSCSFNPASVTLDGLNPATIQITVNTGPAPTAVGARRTVWGAGTGLTFALLFVPWTRRKRVKVVLGMMALMMVALVAVGCGGSGHATQLSNTVAPGTYVINLTATSGTGSTAKAIPVVVTVK